MRWSTQSTHSQITTPNLHVKAADGVTYRYRRFGIPSASNVPLLCLIHFRQRSTTGIPRSSMVLLPSGS